MSDLYPTDADPIDEAVPSYPPFPDDEILPSIPGDPIPNPEPEQPSLGMPDPGIYQGTGGTASVESKG
ncbi:hypothetical protein [Terriglobus aquaticus]|uniref:Uncharacterized protein n=1 Tax=Terriglobus aquaticus TaxID=940139 RepID=A0ABW9KIW5_9BACT|nr:hypothetical protein [Terriglobus aquaticus]